MIDLVVKSFCCWGVSYVVKYFVVDINVVVETSLARSKQYRNDLQEIKNVRGRMGTDRGKQGKRWWSDACPLGGMQQQQAGGIIIEGD